MAIESKNKKQQKYPKPCIHFGMSGMSQMIHIFNN